MAFVKMLRTDSSFTGSIDPSNLDFIISNSIRGFPCFWGLFFEAAAAVVEKSEVPKLNQSGSN